ncbi:transcription elongation factor GreA [Candidatus Dojkabacteria bacterium]|uniref:Transcription elongation factor GreA n=1 Tax=Candidatus Dojkabacteria bacterium TaxID=2099670 RepID=A0A3M0YZU1_9BACT|nr:MAG: transcription elongation factor GreA [Candidatus Dojkabacteria bacterium]
MARPKKKQSSSDGKLQLTKAAYEELQRELKERIEVTRVEIANELAVARELGDLSENHAYQVVMEKKELNENRILELESILAIAEVVEDTTYDNIVSIGDTVELQNVSTDERRIVQLIGTEETMASDSAQGRISVDSPVGSAILGAKVGDLVRVVLPKKTVEYKILRIL